MCKETDYEAKVEQLRSDLKSLVGRCDTAEALAEVKPKLKAFMDSVLVGEPKYYAGLDVQRWSVVLHAKFACAHGRLVMGTEEDLKDALLDITRWVKALGVCSSGVYDEATLQYLQEQIADDCAQLAQLCNKYLRDNPVAQGMVYVTLYVLMGEVDAVGEG